MKDICYSFTMLISNIQGFNQFKMAVQFFGFPNFDGLNEFSKIQQAPGPNFRKVGKSLITILRLRR